VRRKTPSNSRLIPPFPRGGRSLRALLTPPRGGRSLRALLTPPRGGRSLRVLLTPHEVSDPFVSYYPPHRSEGQTLPTLTNHTCFQPANHDRMWLRPRPWNSWPRKPHPLATYDRTRLARKFRN